MRCEKMLYITGDTHGDFYRFCHLGLNDGDIMIILGDVGINYYLNEYDKKLKERLLAARFSVSGLNVCRISKYSNSP